MRLCACLAIFLALLVVGSLAESQERDHIPKGGAVFSGLDKITARTTRFEVELGKTVQFGALLITPRSCFVKPRTEQPQTSAFVDIEQITLKRKVRPLFSGWLIAEAPNLSEVEHPIYDVWLSGCSAE